MKTHFVIGAFTLIVIATAQLGETQKKPTPAATATATKRTANLDLVIQGPFVICEQKTTKNIAIAIPKLDGNHYIPGLTAGLFEYPLAKDPKYPDYTHYVLTLKGSDGGMSARPSNGGPTFYGEPGPCNDLRKASIVISAPRPDEIWPLTTGNENGSVWDTHPNPAGKPTGNRVGCTQDCPYSNKVILRYLKTNIGGISLTCDKTSKGTCPPFPTDKSGTPNPATWPPLPSTLVLIGTEATLVLDAQPVILADNIWSPPLSDYPNCAKIVHDNTQTWTMEKATREEESEAFCASTTLGYKARYFIPSDDKKGSHSFLATVRRDCGSNVVMITAP